MMFDAKTPMRRAGDSGGGALVLLFSDDGADGAFAAAVSGASLGNPRPEGLDLTSPAPSGSPPSSRVTSPAPRRALSERRGD